MIWEDTLPQIKNKDMGVQQSAAASCSRQSVILPEVLRDVAESRATMSKCGESTKRGWTMCWVEPLQMFKVATQEKARVSLSRKGSWLVGLVTSSIGRLQTEVDNDQKGEKRV